MVSSMIPEKRPNYFTLPISFQVRFLRLRFAESCPLIWHPDSAYGSCYALNHPSYSVQFLASTTPHEGKFYYSLTRTGSDQKSRHKTSTKGLNFPLRIIHEDISLPAHLLFWGSLCVHSAPCQGTAHDGPSQHKQTKRASRIETR